MYRRFVDTNISNYYLDFIQHDCPAKYLYNNDYLLAILSIAGVLMYVPLMQ